MNTDTNLMRRLKKGKEQRKAFVASLIKVGIPFQIRGMRKGEEWSQQELADAAGMLQPRISAMESPGYGSLTLETLQRIAAAFDVGLIVRFAPFSELVRWSNTFSPDEFAVPNFSAEMEVIEALPANAVPLAQHYMSGGKTQKAYIPSGNDNLLAGAVGAVGATGTSYQEMTRVA